MKKILLSGVAVLMSISTHAAVFSYDFEGADYSSADWTLTGDAFWANDTGSSQISNSGRAPTRLRTTDNLTYKTGSAWLNTATLDFSQSWSLATTIQVTEENPSAQGADGITLYFQNAGLAANPGIADSAASQSYFSGSWFAIELDLYQNDEDPLTDELTVWNNGSVISDYNNFKLGESYPGDGIFNLSASYNGTDLTVSVSTFTTYSQTIYGVDLSAFDNAVIGFSGETGGYGENHDVLDLSVTAVPEPASISLLANISGLALFIRRRFCD